MDENLKLVAEQKISLWPPMPTVREAVVSKIRNTLLLTGVKAKHYRVIPEDEASKAAIRIEKEAFEGARNISEELEIKALKVYTRDISKRTFRLRRTPDGKREVDEAMAIHEIEEANSSDDTACKESEEQDELSAAPKKEILSSHIAEGYDPDNIEVMLIDRQIVSSDSDDVEFSWEKMKSQVKLIDGSSDSDDEELLWEKMKSQKKVDLKAASSDDSYLGEIDENLSKKKGKFLPAVTPVLKKEMPNSQKGSGSDEGSSDGRSDNEP